MFAGKDRVPVTIDGKNVIYIRATLGNAARGRIQDAAVQVQNVESMVGGQMGQQEIRLSLGAFTTTLLREYVVGWEGPKFQGVPCIPANIDELEAGDEEEQELIDKVVEEASNRYNAKKLRGSGAAGLNGSEGAIVDGVVTSTLK